MHALATLASLKEYVGITGSNIDSQLTTLLEMASSMAEQIIARKVLTGARTERRSGNGRDMLQLRDEPILSVSSLTIDGVAVLNADANDGSGYLFQGSNLYLVGNYCFTRGRLNIVVTYDAGYATVPADLAHAVVEIAAQAFKEKDWIGYQSKSLGGETVAFLRAGVPESARLVLNHYARTYTLD